MFYLIVVGGLLVGIIVVASMLILEHRQKRQNLPKLRRRSKSSTLTPNVASSSYSTADQPFLIQAS